MNKKLLILSIVASSLVVSMTLSKKSSVNAASEEFLMDVNSIQALSHKDGMTVNFINDDMLEMWRSDITDYAHLKEIYEYNTDIQNFGDILGNQQSVRSLYEAYDDFKPTNNTLRWKTTADVSTFDIVVSLNDELTKVIYSQNDLKEMSYTLENPLTNQHYYWQVTGHKRNGETVKSKVFDFVSGDTTRTISVGGVSNTRDLGGVRTQFGEFKQGLVYRSARLDDVDQNGLNTLGKLNIQTDLDVREDGEGAKNPAKLKNYYLKTLINYFFAFDPANRKATIECMKVFTDPNNYPLDFHCTVGRDRTGTLAILLLGLFGASEDYIYHEYYNSLFSVTGAYQKDLNDLNFSIVEQTVDALKAYGSSLTSGVEKFLEPKEDPNTHEMVGLTTEEIQKIRDIFSGKIECPNAPKTKVAEENYEGKCFITFKSLGNKEVVKCIDKGSSVKAPYTLSNDMAWYVNGNSWNENATFNESALIYADYKSNFDVTIHFIGINKADEHLCLLEGEEVSFDQYKQDGYSMNVITDKGKQISKLRVERDTVVNILFTKI